MGERGLGMKGRERWEGREVRQRFRDEREREGKGGMEGRERVRDEGEREGKGEKEERGLWMKGREKGREGRI